MQVDSAKRADTLDVSRPAARGDFHIAIICALTLEADAARALFDRSWDWDGPPYDKAHGDPNSYSTGTIGRHNVVLAHMPSMGTTSAAAVTAHFRSSFPNIQLALVVGVCGAVPFDLDGKEIILGDVIISDSIVQYDFGRQLPDSFERKNTLLDSLGRPNTEIRSLLTKLKSLQERRTLQNKMRSYLVTLQEDPDLEAEYPTTAPDTLFDAKYQHMGGKATCEEAHCNGKIITRERLGRDDSPQPIVHFGLVASGNTVMKSGEARDAVSKKEGVIAFEMESAGVWDSFPCIVIKGVCDYADSHKSKGWQRYAAATAAACMKSFLDYWAPLRSPEIFSSEPRVMWPCHYLPLPKNRRFVGRNGVLWKLRDAFFSERGIQKIAIVGLGGIGKTQVALQLAYWVKEHQPEYSIFWVPAVNEGLFEQACTEIAKLLGVLKDNDNDDLKELVQQHLNSDKTKKWLLIVDNADAYDMMFGSGNKPGLLDYLPETENGLVLFTTRSTEVAVSIMVDDIIDLAKMSTEEGKSLLQMSLTRQQLLQNKDTVMELLGELTYLPLAIAQAAAYLNRNLHMTISKYLGLIRGTEQDITNLMSREFRDNNRYRDQRNAVATTWIVSFEQIRETDKNALDLLMFISQIEPKSIPQSILPKLKTQEELEFAIGTLCGYAFLIRRGEEEMFDMHRLVHLATRVWVNNQDIMRQTVYTALHQICKVFPSNKYQNRQIWRAYMPHAFCILQNHNTFDKDERFDLCFVVGKCLLSDGRISEAVGWLEETDRWRGEQLREEDSSRLSSQHNLAVAYLWNGQITKAVELLEHVVVVLEKTLTEDHPYRLASQHELAGAYLSNGQITKAVDLLEHVVAVEEKTLTEDDPDRLASQHELARAYLKGRQITMASKLLEHVVAIRKKTLAEDHPDRLTSQHELAKVYLEDGQVTEAIELFEYVVTIWKETLTEDHPDCLRSQHELARAYLENRQIKEAVELFEHVVAVWKKTLAEDHPEYLTAQHQLARAYLKDGQITEAVKLVEHVVAIERKSLDNDHPDRLLSTELLETARHRLEAIQL
ncbi:hypothetical protein BX600DRAFT_514139 [Xylariales sp. PMI_506]|nr:hypothetical protein BX600DRAFT_514139 [Xylariales sp. PMI_506]